MRRVLRWIRGAIGNVLTWGVAWFVGGIVLTTILGLPNGLPPLESLALVGRIFGVAGAVFGTAFSAFISANFRGQQVEELKAGRFAFGGALVTIPFVLLLSAWNDYAFSGWVFFSDLIAPVATAATLGGLTAYATVKLAQKSLPSGPEADELEPGRSGQLPG